MSVNRRHADYIHQGIVRANGLVDLESAIHDPELLEVRPDDSLPHVPLEVGNVEIWYFDVIDLSSNSVCIVEIYWETDPLKRTVTCHVAVFTDTPDRGVTNRRQTFATDAFRCAPQSLDITLGSNRLYTNRGTRLKSLIYSVRISIEEIEVELDFHPTVAGWKPWGNRIVFEDKVRSGAFAWLAPLPRGRVNGRFRIGDREYPIQDAMGYYDRTWWNCNYRPATSKQKLFIDDTITRWEWGRFLSPEYSVIFIALHLRPWLNQPPIQSIMLAQNNRIVHSSNNLVRITPSPTGAKTESVPESILVEFPYSKGLATLRLRRKEVIERQNLLRDVGPVIRILASRIFGSPQAYYLLMDGTLSIVETGVAPVQIKGLALYEAMILNEMPTSREDTIRRLLHRGIK